MKTEYFSDNSADIDDLIYKLLVMAAKFIQKKISVEIFVFLTFEIQFYLMDNLLFNNEYAL
jgi:hypothetical protein